MADTDRQKVRTNVYVREEQREWVREKNINLSSLVRDAIDERRHE